MTKKKVGAKTKGGLAGGLGGVLTAYLAIKAHEKLGLPPEASAEIASAAAGGVMAFIGAWAGKLMPNQ